MYKKEEQNGERRRKTRKRKNKERIRERDEKKVSFVSRPFTVICIRREHIKISIEVKIM